MKLGIHLTQPTPRCRVGIHGRLPQHGRRIRVAVFDRSGMSAVSGPDAVARRLPVSQMWGDEGEPGPSDLVPVLWVSAPNLGDGGDGVPGHTQAFDHVVSGDVVCDQPEK